jgi:hypothetical protein
LRAQPGSRGVHRADADTHEPTTTADRAAALSWVIRVPVENWTAVCPSVPCTCRVSPEIAAVRPDTPGARAADGCVDDAAPDGAAPVADAGDAVDAEDAPPADPPRHPARAATNRGAPAATPTTRSEDLIGTLPAGTA